MYGDQSILSRVEYLINRQTTSNGSSVCQNCQKERSKGDCSCYSESAQNLGIIETMEDQEMSKFEQLPISAFLHIISFLDAKDIRNLSMTCWQFHDICSDQHLWKTILEKDKLKWDQIGHATNPSNLQKTYRNMSYKDIYMRCSPDFKRKEHFNVFHLPKLLMSYLPTRHVPKIVLCGPGLDSDTSIIVRKMIGDLTPDVFKNLGPFPAMFPGSVGTGFTVCMENKSTMRLITMYSGTKATREQKPLEDRSNRSRLIRPITLDQAATNEDAWAVDQADDTQDEFKQYEPTPSIKHLCQEVNGFVYVVESTTTIGSVAAARQELHALLDPKWTPHSTPLVVLCCTPAVDTPRTPCVTIGEQLRLDRLSRPWKAMDADTDSLAGVMQGIRWLLNTIQGR